MRLRLFTIIVIGIGLSMASLGLVMNAYLSAERMAVFDADLREATATMLTSGILTDIPTDRAVM